MISHDSMIVEQAYWDDSYDAYVFNRVPGPDPTRQLIRRLVPPASLGQTAFEIGCFPGRYLVELGELGYIVNGCDLTERVERDLGPWLASQGCRVGQLVRGDYRTSCSGKYDIAASFGFVEHFEDFRSVVEFQVNLVKPGGIAIIQFPNFHGAVQRFLRQVLDRDNLANHVIDAMDLRNYHPWVSKFGDVVFSGHYGHFDFWIDDFTNRNGAARRRMIRGIEMTRRLWGRIPDSAHWSPYAAIAIRV